MTRIATPIPSEPTLSSPPPTSKKTLIAAITMTIAAVLATVVIALQYHRYFSLKTDVPLLYHLVLDYASKRLWLPIVSGVGLSTIAIVIAIQCCNNKNGSPKK